jgi:hypothetical protein
MEVDHQDWCPSQDLKDHIARGTPACGSWPSLRLLITALGSIRKVRFNSMSFLTTLTISEPTEHTIRLSKGVDFQEHKKS